MDGWGTFLQLRHINSKNCVHCADGILYNMAPMLLEEAKLTVGCGIGSTSVLLPCFLEKVTSTGMKTYAITSARFKRILQIYAIPEFQQHIPSNNNIWNLFPIVWAVRPLGIHITVKLFYDHPVFIYKIKEILHGLKIYIYIYILGKMVGIFWQVFFFIYKNVSSLSKFFV